MTLYSQFQKTLSRKIIFNGIGLHSGFLNCKISIFPQPPNSGISFISNGIKIPATVDSVVSTKLSTTISSKKNPNTKISTIEHLMAAFSATKIDNALVEVNGPEIPILDGSSIEFVDSILKNGISEQIDKNKCFPKYFLKIETPVHASLNDNDSEAWLFPTKCDKNKFIKNYNINYDENNNQNSIENIKFDFTLSGNIDFSENNLPQKHIKTSVSKFHEIAGARTFAFEKDIEFMRKHGLAKGGSLSNAVVFDNKGNALNKEKLRFKDEWAKHKLLDCIGDLYLCGKPIIGHYHGNKPGHELNIKLVRKLLSDKNNFSIISL